MNISVVCDHNIYASSQGGGFSGPKTTGQAKGNLASVGLTIKIGQLPAETIGEDKNVCVVCIPPCMCAHKK